MSSPLSRKLGILCVVPLLSIPAACRTASPEPTPMVSGGTTSYTIIVPDDPDTGNRFALKELQVFLKEASGADFAALPSSKAPEKNRIFLGLSETALKALGKDPRPEMEDQDSCVRTAGGDLFLFGKGPWGDMSAVYDYLENVLGYRWYDARGGMKVPDCRTIPWRELDRKNRFAVTFRAATGYWIFHRPQAHLAFLRNRQNFAYIPQYLKAKGILIPDLEESIVSSAHTLPSYIPAAYGGAYPPYAWLKGKNYRETNPGFFGMNANGKRDSVHLCFSNPELKKELTANILEHMDRERKRSGGRKIFSVSAHDSPGKFCHCPGCTALEKQYKTPCAAYFLYLIELANEVKEKFPENKISFLVYRKDQTQIPPAGIDRLPDNLIPVFAPIDDDFSKSWTHENNKGTRADLKRWGEISAGLGVWYYPNPYGGSITRPLGNIRRLVTDIREMVKAGMTHSYFEHNVGVSNMIGFTELQSFLILQLMKDSSQDADALIREFMEFEYGPAAPLMMKYLEELENEALKSTAFMSWDAALSAYVYLTPENLLRWYGYFEEMEQLLADSPVRLYNMKRVKINLELAMLARYNKIIRKYPGFQRSPESLAESVRSVFSKTIEDFYDKEFAFRAKSALRSVNAQLDMCLIQAGKEGKPLPKEIFGNIPAEDIFQMVPSTNGRSREKDPDAAWGVAAVQMKDPVPRLPYPAHFYDYTAKKYSPNLSRITKETLGPRGEYKIYEVARVNLSPNCDIRFGQDNWFSIKANLGEAYEEGSLNRVAIYASLKFEGPAFYPEDEGKTDRVLCDRVIVVRKPDLKTE